MSSANSNDTWLCKNDQDEITSFLKQYEAYIRAQARRLVPRNIFAPEVIDLEMDELVQKSRIKLWQVLQERVITNPRAYINAVVRSEAINATRQHGPLLPLPVDADGELYQEGTIGRAGEDMQDPAVIFEQKEQMAEHTACAVNGTLDLPPNQRKAMICALKEDVDDAQLLAQVFKRHGVNIEAIDWPGDKAAASRSRALLVSARQKLCSSMVHRRARQEMDTQPFEATQQGTSGSASAVQQVTSSHENKEASPLKQSIRKPSVNAEDSGDATEIDGADVDKLREPYRTAVCLHYIQKRSYPQIATEMKLPEGTVKSLVCRGMKMLQKYREQGDVKQGGEPGREMENGEGIADMAAQIEHVAEPYRTALYLHYVRNLSYPQMAAELDLPEGTVKSQISRGMKILRTQYKRAQ